MKVYDQKLKVLLVGNPRTVMGFNRLTKLPALNLASLAANVDEDLVEIRIIDLVLKDKKPEKYLHEILQDFKPQVVGFTAMSFQYSTALRFIQLTRSWSKEVVTILGGYHATADGGNILARDVQHLIDFVIDGEGEVPFNQLIRSLKYGGSLQDVPGIWYREDGKVLKNPRVELLAADKIKLPDRNARILKKGFHILGMPADTIETSRGCVYDCNFCSIRNMYGKSFRKFSISRILTDLQDAQRFGAKSIFITDDNITLDPKRLELLCEEIVKANLKMTFAVQASVRGFTKNPELTEAMARAGMKIVFLGIENVSDRALNFMQKSNQLSFQDTVKVVRQLKKYGILVVGGFIFGHPEDDRNSLLENFKFAKRMGIDLPLFNILTPHLNTELRGELMEKGLVTNSTDYSTYNHYASNVRTHYLSSEELFRLRNELDARYPVESGSFLRLVKKYPGFFISLPFKMLATEPANLINFTTGGLTRKKSV